MYDIRQVYPVNTCFQISALRFQSQKNGLMNILWCFDVQGGFYISYISYVKEKICKEG